jgi:acyl carrier protein
MLERDQIRDIVFRAIDRVKELSFDESALPNDESAILLGEGAGLDSMGFVNFVVALEEEMSCVTDRPLSIPEELNSPDAETEPISTMGEFIDFLYNLTRS